MTISPAQESRMPYEEGMSIEHDEGRKLAIVTFRGNQITLARRYDTAQEARLAGEHYCRQIGWDGK